MQKKLIALALASLAGSAFAQSNVTIYGVMDVSEAYVKATGGQDFAAGSVRGAQTAFDQKGMMRLDSNSSYIGFKGVEDLGNGLKAIWQYESGIAADTAGGMAGGRDTYLGLTGNFGTLVAGTLTHPLRAMGAKVSLLPGGAGVGTTESLTGKVLGINTGAAERAQNAVAYVTPNFSGFSGTVAWVNGERRTEVKNNVPFAGAKDETSNQWQVAGQYENGPLWVALGYHEAKDTRTLATNLFAAAGDNDKAKVWRAAATYVFPTNTKLTALIDQTKYTTQYGGVGAIQNDGIKRTAWSLGVSQGFGKHTVALEYARSGDLSGTTCSNLAAGYTCGDTDASMYTLSYAYEFSKRTMLHARYSKLNQDQSALMNLLGANHQFYNNTVTGNVTAGTGADSSALMVGLRHSF